jgi:hypothetical protein
MKRKKGKKSRKKRVLHFQFSFFVLHYG